MPHAYVLREPRSWGRVVMAALGGVLGLVGYLVARTLWDWEGGSTPILLFSIASVGFGVWGEVHRSVLLRIDGDGVGFGAVSVPWASVWQLVLLRPEPVAGAFRTDLPPQVGLRLKRGAPLPSGMESLVFDPNDPLAIPDQLRSAVTRPEIDGSAVLAAAAAFSPPDVTLAERVGEEERQLAR